MEEVVVFKKNSLQSQQFTGNEFDCKPHTKYYPTTLEAMTNFYLYLQACNFDLYIISTTQKLGKIYFRKFNNKTFMTLYDKEETSLLYKSKKHFFFCKQTKFFTKNKFLTIARMVPTQILALSKTMDNVPEPWVISKKMYFCLMIFIFLLLI